MLCVNSNDTSKVICPDWVFFSFVSISNLNTCLSDLRDTVDWGKKWLVDFNARKTWLVSIEGQTKLCHHQPPSTTPYHQPKHIYHHTQASKNGLPLIKNQNIFLYNLLLTFQQFLFLQNALFLSVTEILYAKFWSVCFSNSIFLRHFTHI